MQNMYAALLDLVEMVIYVLEHNPYYAQPFTDDEECGTPECSEVSSDSEDEYCD